MIIFIVIIWVIFFGAWLYWALKEVFTTKEPVWFINWKVIYKTTWNHWVYNLVCFLLAVYIFSWILQIISYYLK